MGKLLGKHGELNTSFKCKPFLCFKGFMDCFVQASVKFKSIVLQQQCRILGSVNPQILFTVKFLVNKLPQKYLIE